MTRDSCESRVNRTSDPGFIHEVVCVKSARRKHQGTFCAAGRANRAQRGLVQRRQHRYVRHLLQRLARLRAQLAERRIGGDQLLQLLGAKHKGAP